MKKFSILLILIIASLSSYGQFGKLLKEKAKGLASKENLNKLKGLASGRLNDARAELDSTAFNFAISVNDNADLINTDSRKDKAIKLITSFNGQEEDNDLDKARSLKDAGELAYAKGFYKRAEALLFSSKLLYEENDPKDVNYFTVIADLGLLYSTMGRYVKAEEYTSNALNLRKANLGDNNIGVGASLNNLAVLQKETGNYNEAEINIKRAIEIIRTESGERTMPLAITINNYAMLSQSLGRFDRAVELMDQVIGISSALQNEKSTNHQKFLSNQAILFREKGEYDKALSLFQNLAAIKEKRLGTKHPDYAHLLINIAAVHLQLGQNEKVESLLKQALEIYESKFDKEHKLYAAALNDLGNYYLFNADYEQAKTALEESLSLKEKVLGVDHPDFVRNKEDVALLNWKTGNVAEAHNLFKEVLAANMEFINSYFPPMSEAEKTRYWDQLRPSFDSFYAFAFDIGKDKIIEEAFEFHIATKGILLNSSNKIKDQILNSNDDKLIARYLEWVDQKELLARYYNYSKEEIAEKRINLDSIENAANNSERWLSQQSDLFKENLSVDQVATEDVMKNISVNWAAIEVIRFADKLDREIKYGIVSLSNSDISHALIKNGRQLETRYFKYYTNAVKQKIQDDYSYDQYWVPIANTLGSTKKLYFSGDGVYNQINLYGLTKSGSFVIDSYDIRYIGNTKNIGGKENTKTQRDAFLLGNPVFGDPNITSLPGTEVELNSISGKLKNYGYKYQMFTSANASEANIKTVNSPKILHIATHGYFIKDDDLKGPKVFGVNSERAVSNPLLRSGLILANAGKVEDQTVSLSSNENGILTAYEATNLSLEGTDLVVLSACETAVGDVKAGEGVYGLQRAFLAAGAGSIMMSLWKVDDAATQQLMTSFYDQLLKTKDKHQAFLNATKNLKTKYKHPYYWSGFVLVEN